MSFVTHLNQAIDRAKQATEADNAGDYERALVLYTECLDSFLLAMSNDQNEERRKTIMEKVEQITARAEKIKQHHDSLHPQEEAENRNKDHGESFAPETESLSQRLSSESKEGSVDSLNSLDEDQDMLTNVVNSLSKNSDVRLALNFVAQKGTTLKNVLDTTFDLDRKFSEVDTIVFLRGRKPKNETQSRSIATYSKAFQLMFSKLRMNSHYMLAFKNSSNPSATPILVHAAYKDEDHNGSIFLHDAFFDTDDEDRFAIVGQFTTKKPFVLSDVIEDFSEQIVANGQANSCWEVASRIFSHTHDTLEIDSKTMEIEVKDQKEAVEEATKIGVVILGILAMIPACFCGVPYWIWTHGEEEGWYIAVRVLLILLSIAVAVLFGWVLIQIGPAVLSVVVDVVENSLENR